MTKAAFLLCLLFLGLSFSCANEETNLLQLEAVEHVVGPKSETQPSTRPSEDEVVAAVIGYHEDEPPPEYINTWTIWASGRALELSKQFQINPPDLIIVHYTEPPSKPVFKGFVLVTTGMYVDTFKTIHIWTLTVDHCPMSKAEFLETFYHEFLHHLDYEKGNPSCPNDHAALFVARIKALGIDTPNNLPEARVPRAESSPASRPESAPCEVGPDGAVR